MGTPLGPKYIPYTYMDPLGKVNRRGIRGHCSEGSFFCGFVSEQPAEKLDSIGANIRRDPKL